MAVEKEPKLAKQQALDSVTVLIKEGFQPEKIVECIKNLTLEDVIKLQGKVDK